MRGGGGGRGGTVWGGGGVEGREGEAGLAALPMKVHHIKLAIVGD